MDSASRDAILESVIGQEEGLNRIQGFYKKKILGLKSWFIAPLKESWTANGSAH